MGTFVLLKRLLANMAVNDPRVILNIGGKIFETYQSTLDKFPETLLGRLGPKSSHYNEWTNTYFFDRNRQAFEAILFFYQSTNLPIRDGLLSCPPGQSITLFEQECLYFELPKYAIKAM